jgi:Fe2+ transport system protein FeoA
MKPGVTFTDSGAAGETSPPAPHELLADLPEGACGRILSVGASALDLERLEVMGLCEGRLVQVIKQGNPMIVRALGTRIGLAATLAGAVRVRRDPAPSSPEETDPETGSPCTRR